MSDTLIDAAKISYRFITAANGNDEIVTAVSKQNMWQNDLIVRGEKAPREISDCWEGVANLQLITAMGDLGEDKINGVADFVARFDDVRDNYLVDVVGAADYLAAQRFPVAETREWSIGKAILGVSSLREHAPELADFVEECDARHS